MNLNIHDILKILPHKYPFLLLDKVVDIVAEESGTGIKNVTINEQFFQGHFPNHPIMPGVLIIEAMAQTAAIVVKVSSSDDKLVYFMSVEEAKFRKPVLPGDVLFIHVTKERSRGDVWKFKGNVKVEGNTVAEAVFTAMMVNKS